MVDIKILRDLGITQESLKKRLSVDPAVQDGTPDERGKVSKLLNRLRSRNDAGISRSFSDWQWLHMIDKAWETPFTQFHPRLFGAIDQGQMETACSILSSLNLGGLVETTTDAAGKPSVKFNEEKFRLLVGLVRSYTTIRWAKIVNDRRLTPFLKFEPAKAMAVPRAKCELLTDRVNVMAQQYGYFEVMKQHVLKMLQYGTALKFIKEEWHWEEQLRPAVQADVDAKKPKYGTVTDKNKSGTPCALGDNVAYVEREGLRYDIPHPSRVFRDLAHPLYTLNSDSGVSYVGYWQVVPWREVRTNNWWNTDKVTFGSSSIISTNKAFFETVYTACRMEIPVITRSVAPSGAGANDLQQQQVNDVYTTDMDDKGVVLTNYFEKLVPSENGLGNYDFPVWFRFVLAGEARTVLYAAPLPSCPSTYLGYDADESRYKNASLALEILPYQYQFENLLQQILESCKQNLANFTMVNTDVMDDNQVKEIKGLGPMLWQKLNLFGTSFKKNSKAWMKSGGVSSAQDLGISLALPKANIAELVNVLKTVLDVLERVLVMSSHEVAQAASHEQTREEVRNIAQSTSSRLTFTATPVDIERDAWKRQIYAFLMSNGDDDFYGTIPAETEITKEQLTKMGFSFVDSDEVARKDKWIRVRAKKSNLALPLYSFASTRDGEDRTSDRETAVVMATFARDILNNPMTATAIGPDQALDMANKIAHLSGIDRDFKLRNVGGTPEEQKQKAQEELQQVVEIVLQQTAQQTQKALLPLLDEVKEIQAEVGMLMRLTGAAPEQANAQPQPEAVAGGPS